MKKSILLITTLAFCLIIFVACSGDMGYDGDMSVNPGLYPEIGAMTDSAGNNFDDNYNFEDIIESGFTLTSEQNKSFFSLDKNTASYSLMRNQIMNGLAINKNSVRLEEYINYFNYDYPEPTGDDALAISGGVIVAPYNDNNMLLRIGVSAESVSFENRRPNNIVFLIDTSGSMYGSDRLGLIQQSFTMLLDYLNEEDTISIVTYAGGTSVALEGARGIDKTLIANVISDLAANGSTNGSGGIQLAYQVASKYFVEGGNNRVILATDGDFNVGISGKNELESFISEKRDTGIYLSVLGVGMYNTNDTIMSTLAQHGNGNYAYLDSIKEAYKVLVQELEGTFNVVAKDAKIGVTFNTNVVESYRLVGYETKMMNQEEFDDPNKDAGEIGSGHTVTAVYEIVLREDAPFDENIAEAELRYKAPDTNQDKSVTKTFGYPLDVQYSEDEIFVSCVVEFGLVLRQSQYRGEANLESVIERLSTLNCVKEDGFKAEFLQIVQKANEIETYKNLEPCFGPPATEE